MFGQSHNCWRSGRSANEGTNAAISEGWLKLDVIVDVVGDIIFGLDVCSLFLCVDFYGDNASLHANPCVAIA